MVIPAFGFSVGDFIAAINLLKETTKALREVSGATSQFQSTILDLNLLEKVLTSVQRLDPQPVKDSTLHAVQLCGQSCFIPLSRFLKSIDKFEGHLAWSSHGSRTISNRITAAGRKAQWALSVEGKVAKLKASIGPQLTTINLLLQLEQLDQHKHHHSETTETLSTVRQVQSQVTDLAKCTQDNLATRGSVESLTSIVRNMHTRMHTTAQQCDVEVLSLALERSLPGLRERYQLIRYGLWSPPLTGFGCRVMLNQPSENGMAMLMETAQRSEVLLKTIASLLRRPDATKPAGEGTPRKPDLDDTEHMGARAVVNGRVVRLPQFLQSLLMELAPVLVIIGFLTGCFHRLARTYHVIIRAPRLLLDSNIRLTDALGRSRSLPYEQFCHWHTMHSWLRQEFRGNPGDGLVQLEHYAMFRENPKSPHSTFISAQAWFDSIRPGQKVIMSIELQSHSACSDACHSCGCRLTSSGSMFGWIQW